MSEIQKTISKKIAYIFFLLLTTLKCICVFYSAPMENQGKSDVQLEWLHEVEDYVERATEREAQDVSPKQSIGNFLNARFIPIGTALHFKLV